MKSIVALPRLRLLEISGHSYRYYDPALLGSISQLHDLRITMPDAIFRDALLGIVRQLDEKPQGGLKGFAIVAKVCLIRQEDK